MKARLKNRALICFVAPKNKTLTREEMRGAQVYSVSMFQMEIRNKPVVSI